MAAEWTLSEPLELVVAGFGGQGVMLLGQLMTYAGMKAGKKCSWIPSYGPEMRGGTANCGVILSEVPIGSPLVSEPNGAIILNAPSFDKFEPALLPGGSLVVNSSMVPQRSQRTDIKIAYVDATQVALKLGNRKAASMVTLGAFLELYGQVPLAAVEAILGKLLKEKLIPVNVQAIAEGARIAREQLAAVSA